MLGAIPPDQKTHLTRLSGVELARAIRSGEISSREVVEAHIERVRRTNDRVNAIVADRFDSALAEADEADRRVAQADDPAELPPLLGVPCTIKESIQMEGMPNAVGVLARKEIRSQSSAPVVERIQAAGAIPLGVTNTSELTLWVETSNRLYGLTRNPYDPRRTAGGSSGGEGAAVGAGMAPFGIGSDIGGSIRIPAFFNGVFGHKPTPGLVPTNGQWPPATHDAVRLFGCGPLARRAEDLMPALRAIAGPDPGDPFSSEMELGDPAEVDMAGLEVLVGSGFSFYPLSADLTAARERAAVRSALRG